MKRTLLYLIILLSSLSSYSLPLKGVGGASPRLYLSGVDAGHTKTWQFFCSKGQHSGKWSKIQVPCSWELQGFGAYTYGRFYKTKGAKPSDETGRYKTSFTTPKDWNGKTLRLTFEGSMTDTQVWIDGKLVNTLLLDGKNTGKSLHQGGFMEFSYDVTPFIIPGKKQTIEVLVSKESANKSVNSAERRADWWLFGGIYRPVYIEALPKEHIENLKVYAKANGDIIATMNITDSNLTGSDLTGSSLTGSVPDNLVVRLFDSSGTPVALSAPSIHTSQEGLTTVTTHANNIKPWDPEHPNLYTINFSLPSSEGIGLNLGFRTIEFRPHDGIYLNGTKLIVKGTNRHCFWPETGRAVSREQSLMDAKLIKGMNMNAVRCHYPSDRHFMDICDSIGLLYLAEFPGWQTHYDDTTAQRLMHEFIPTMENHPCVFIWSNGNEGGWNTSVDHLFADLDLQKRKVVHPWSDFDGIDTHHYPAYQTGAYRLQNGDNVFMPTEFLHSKYDKGAGSALEDMWSHWTKSPLFAGGFIWAYVDEAVRRTDCPITPQGGNLNSNKSSKNNTIKEFPQPGVRGLFLLDSDGGNGPDGCMDPYRQPEASYYTIREVWSPVYIDKLNVTPNFNGQVLVSNRYLFSNLSECSMRYKVKDGYNHIVDEGSVTLPSLNPGESGYARFTIPKDFFNNDILELTAYDNNSHEICLWSSPIKRAEDQSPLTPQGGTLNSNNSSSKAGSVQRNSNSKAGSVQRNSVPLLCEWGTDGQVQCGNFEGPLFVGMNAECYKHKSYKDKEGNLVHTYYYKGAVDSIQWRQTPDGLLYMDATILNDERGHGYNPSTGSGTGILTDESKWQLGLSFKYPESEVDSVSWMGRGPYRVWRNRLKGQQFGIWGLKYNNTVTGQYNSATPPIYPEFKGYRSDLRWVEFFKDNVRSFKVYSETENLYLRLFTPEEAVDQTPGEMGGLQEGSKPKSERTMIKFPEGDISFLLSIPPMQSYKPLEQLGPQSQPDNIRIKAGDDGFHIKLVFDFR